MRELMLELPTLSPPPGGLARLRSRLHAQRHRDGWRVLTRPLTWAMASGAAVMVAVAWLIGSIQAERNALARVEGAMQGALQASIDSPRIADGGALELPSADASVRVFLVMSDTRAADFAGDHHGNVDDPR